MKPVTLYRIVTRRVDKHGGVWNSRSSPMPRDEALEQYEKERKRGGCVRIEQVA